MVASLGALVGVEGGEYSVTERTRTDQGLLLRDENTGTSPKKRAEKEHTEESKVVCRGEPMRPCIKQFLQVFPRNSLLCGPGLKREGASDRAVTFVFPDGRELRPGAEIQRSSWELRSLAVSPRESLCEGPTASRFPPPESVRLPLP